MNKISALETSGAIWSNLKIRFGPPDYIRESGSHIMIGYHFRESEYFMDKEGRLVAGLDMVITNDRVIKASPAYMTRGKPSFEQAIKEGAVPSEE